MNKNYISKKEFIAMGLIFLNALAMLFSVAADGGKDAYICVLIAGVIMIPIPYIIQYIFIKYPQKNFYEIVEVILGKIIGKIFIIILLGYNIYITATVVLDICAFINTVVLDATALIVIVILFIWRVYILLKGTIKDVANWSQLVLWAIVFFIIVAVVLMIPSMKFENILPIGKEGIENISLGVLQTLGYPLSQIFVMVTLCEYVENRKEISKIFYWILGISVVFMCLITIQNIMVLGADNRKYIPYSNYVAYRHINIKTMFQRIELMLSAFFVLSQILKVYIYILFILKGIQHLLKLNSYKCILIPVILMIINRYIADDYSDFTRGEESRILQPIMYMVFNYLSILFMATILFVKSALKNPENK